MQIEAKEKRRVNNMMIDKDQMLNEMFVELCSMINLCLMNDLFNEESAMYEQGYHNKFKMTQILCLYIFEHC